MRRALILLFVSVFAVGLAIDFESSAADSPGRAGQKPAEVQIDPKTFDDYVGQYVFAENPDLVLSFFREGTNYFIQASSQGRIQIYPASISKFFTKILDADATFVRDPQGKVIAVLWRQGDRTSRAQRTSDQPAILTDVAFNRREEMIRMRDGVRLHTLIFTPKVQKESLPILMERTPYGISDSDSDAINRRYRDLVRDGYVFVLQDIRGRYGSEGQFVMNRPLHDPRDAKGIDESTDTYDTIDWLVKNIKKNNRRVGILGVSYDGWLSAVATINAHPALKASSPQAPMTDTWLGDDFFQRRVSAKLWLRIREDDGNVEREF